MFFGKFVRVNSPERTPLLSVLMQKFPAGIGFQSILTRSLRTSSVTSSNSGHSTQLHFYSLFERQKMKWNAGKHKREWPLPTFKRLATNNHTLQKTDELVSSRLPRFSGAHFPSLVSFTIICRWKQHSIDSNVLWAPYGCINLKILFSRQMIDLFCDFTSLDFSRKYRHFGL